MDGNNNQTFIRNILRAFALWHFVYFLSVEKMFIK